MNDRRYKITFEVDVSAAGIGEAVEMAKDAVLLDYAKVFADDEEIDI